MEEPTKPTISDAKMDAALKPPKRKRKPHQPKLNLPKLVNVTHYIAETFYFKFEHGWASFTLNEETGEVNVQSDWGNSSHWWGFEGRGKVSLKDFLAGRSNVGYLVDKFCRTAELKNVIDGSLTLKTLKKDFADKTRHRDLSKELRAELRESLESLCRELDGKPDHDAAWAVYNSQYAHDLDDFIHDEDFTYAVQYRPSGWARVWAELLLPTFCDHLKAQGYGRKSASGTVGEAKAQQDATKAT